MKQEGKHIKAIYMRKNGTGTKKKIKMYIWPYLLTNLKEKEDNYFYAMEEGQIDFY